MVQLDGHLFEREYLRLVGMLSRRFGVHHLASVEDAVQFAFAAAVETWPTSSVPDRPSAWLFRVAHNRFMGEKRLHARREELVSLHQNGPNLPLDMPNGFLSGEVPDELLRMLFVCCDEAIPVESQLVLALRTLCGVDVRGVAERLFTSEANTYKRLSRARSRLREIDVDLQGFSQAQVSARLPTVQSILYALFTEGHLSSHGDGAIRQELCDEAIRLTKVLAAYPASATPETCALLALMLLHRARLAGRQDAGGELVLLEDQDRSRWNSSEIHEGLSWLVRSAQGDAFSRFHAEAGIAAEHCMAPSFAATRWDRIVEGYALLERVTPSALHTVNRAVALAEWRGPAAGLALLEGMEPPPWLEGSYVWMAVLADLHQRCGHRDRAQRFRTLALEGAPSEAVRGSLRRRLGSV